MAFGAVVQQHKTEECILIEINQKKKTFEAYGYKQPDLLSFFMIEELEKQDVIFSTSPLESSPVGKDSRWTQFLKNLIQLF